MLNKLTLLIITIVVAGSASTVFAQSYPPYQPYGSYHQRAVDEGYAWSYYDPGYLPGSREAQVHAN